MSLDDIKQIAGQRADEIVGRLLPGAVLKGGKWLARNPNRNDKRAGSFVIHASRSAKAGGFCDYASGDTGSALDLIPYLVHGMVKPDPKTACDLTLAWLGIKGSTVSEDWLAAERRKADVRARDFELRAERQAEKDRGRAQAVFMAGEPIIGTPAQAYIETARGVPLASLAQPPGALRYGEAEPHWLEPRGPCGAPRFPALIAAMSRWNQPIAAIQRTYLTEEGQKAAVGKTKLIYPASVGAVIRLSKGGNRLSPESAAANGLTGETLILCEGAEDGLTCMLAQPLARVWAVCGVTNLRHVQVPPSVSRVIVAADNDWQGSAARMALDDGLMALKSQCRTVDLAFAANGKDFNDWLRG